ncbi:MAG TPA: hypothetical protein VFE05_03325 [Longimicrobiaceae bacterium]|nr:hypothetical protein [Longimicrobiaceae bacterium]
MREVSRSRLTVEEGRSLYVEPSSLAAMQGDVFIAGAPTYLFARPAAGRRWSPAGTNSVFGALVHPDGGAQTVPSPLGSGLTAGPRVLGRDEGGWEAVFAEQERPSAKVSERVPIRGLWYGRFDGGNWSRLERLPLPVDGQVLPWSASALVRAGDTLAWAMVVHRSGERDDVLLFERRGGRWTSELILVRTASYVALAYAPGRGLVLAIVHPDSTVRSGDENSLFLWSRTPAWHPWRRLALGGPEPVHEPVFSATASSLGWLAMVRGAGHSGYEARALAAPAEASPEEAIVVDSDAMAAIPLNPRGAGAVWLTRHLPTKTSSELRVVRRVGTSVAVLGSAPDPFVGFAGAVATGPSEMLVTGAAVDSADSLVASLLIRLRTECRPASGEKPGAPAAGGSHFTATREDEEGEAKNEAVGRGRAGRAGKLRGRGRADGTRTTSQQGPGRGGPAASAAGERQVGRGPPAGPRRGAGWWDGER